MVNTGVMRYRRKTLGHFHNNTDETILHLFRAQHSKSPEHRKEHTDAGCGDDTAFFKNTMTLSLIVFIRLESLFAFDSTAVSPRLVHPNLFFPVSSATWTNKSTYVQLGRFNMLHCGSNPVILLNRS